MNKEYAGKCLAVDSDIENAKLFVFEWAEHNIKMDRSADMTEAMEYLSSNDYIFVGINGDTVDFMPLLKEMRSMTDTPILIIAQDFTTEAEIATLENGADLCIRLENKLSGNVTPVLAHITRISERAKHYEPLTNIFTRTRGLFLSCDHFGDLIKSARKFNGMTQAELCDRLHIGIRHLKAIENNHKKPSFNLFERLISELEVSSEIALDIDNEILRIYAKKKQIT